MAAFPRVHLFLPFFAALVLFLAGSDQAAGAFTPNAQELALGNLMTGSPDQQRSKMFWNPILARVARERAKDLATRDYFAHVNPDGHAINFLVRQAGYVLPDFYPAEGNNLESIGGGRATAGEIWSDFMASAGHRQHLLAEAAFFAPQTSYGVGYYEDPSADYRYYWVVVTAPPMPAPNRVRIDAPMEGSRIPEGPATISGVTQGMDSAAEVQISLRNAAGVTDFKPLSGSKSWSGPLSGLEPGKNLVRVRSLKANGEVLASTNEEITYVVNRSMQARVTGQGSVGSFAGSSTREVGREYTINAQPAEGWVFAGWSGDWNYLRPSITFTMPLTLDVTANFVLNPFPAVRGGFRGLIGPTDAAVANRGLIQLCVNGTGRFTGKVYFQGGEYPLLGDFSGNGRAQVRIVPPQGGAIILSLVLDLVDPAGAVTGTLTSSQGTVEFGTERVLGGEDAAAGLAGQYTMALRPLNPPAAAPQGTGFAVFNVEPSGQVSVEGRLADGRAFAQVARLASDGKLDLFLPLYGRGGALGGRLTFAAATGEVTGTLRWTKPKRVADLYFPAGFDTSLTGAGESYVGPTAGQPVLAVAGGPNNARLAFSGGDLPADQSPVIQTVTLATNNQVTISPPVLPPIEMSINVLKGRMRGSFKHPATGALSKFRGVILQHQSVGAGYFLGVEQSGTVQLMPIP